MTITKKQEEFMNSKGAQMRHFWDYYSLKKSAIPVYSRRPFDNLKAKTHTNAHVDYFGDIIGIKQGYIGEKVEISYNIEDASQELLSDMLVDAHMATINSQTIEYSSVEGLSHRLCYTEDGVFKQKNLHGWQVIYEGPLLSPTLAYYFYEKDDEQYCQVYDDIMVTYYKKTKDKKGDKKTEYIEFDSKEHNFDRIPIVPFLNNSNAFSNCDASIGLMNEYDAVLSDSIAEIKDLRRALLKVKGDIYTEQDSEGNPIPIPESVANSSVLVFGADMDGKSVGDAEYMNNNLNDEAITSTLDRLRGLIYETSGSIDLKELSTAERVFSIKASLLRLENDAKTTENYFKLGINKVLELWAYLMNETGSSIDEKAFEIHIGRKIPADEALMAELFIKLSSVLSVEDALRMAGFENAKELAERATEVIIPDFDLGE